MKRPLILLALLAASPFAASAQNASGLNYNYVEGGYVATNLDNNNGDIDADGFGANGSVALSDNFHLFGGFNRQDTDTFELFQGGNRVDTHMDQWRLGVGYNLPIAATTDLVARAAYEKFQTDDVTIDGVRYDVGHGQDGYSAEVGLRSALGANFEGAITAGYQDFGGNADDFYGRVGAVVKFNPNWALSGDVKFADHDTTWFVGPRFSW